MAQTSVAQFAGELKGAPSVLLEQLRAAGVNKSMADDILSEQDKAKLLDYLRRVHGHTYRDYTTRVGRFLPWLGRTRDETNDAARHYT